MGSDEAGVPSLSWCQVAPLEAPKGMKALTFVSLRVQSRRKMKTSPSYSGTATLRTSEDKLLSAGRWHVSVILALGGGGGGRRMKSS